MSSVNKVILVGNLGSDPDVRQTQSGQTVCTLSVATSESWFDKNANERKEKTEWHRVVVWGKAAEACQKYLSKGRKVYVEGKLQTRKWEKDGETKYSTEIVAAMHGGVVFLSSKGEGGGGGQPQRNDGYGGPSNRGSSAPSGGYGGGYGDQGVDYDDQPF